MQTIDGKYIWLLGCTICVLFWAVSYAWVTFDKISIKQTYTDLNNDRIHQKLKE